MLDAQEVVVLAVLGVLVAIVAWLLVHAAEAPRSVRVGVAVALASIYSLLIWVMLAFAVFRSD